MVPTGHIHQPIPNPKPNLKAAAGEAGVFFYAGKYLSCLCQALPSTGAGMAIVNTSCYYRRTGQSLIKAGAILTTVLI